jgi:predicted dehydrogenase
VVAVADLIPQRRQALMREFGVAREYADAEALIGDREVELVSVCVPNHLHMPVSSSALRAGKHVVCELPAGLCAADARRIERAAVRAGKVVHYASQRRFGAAEQAVRQAIARGYAGEIVHARAAWTRTRAVPIGTGWYTDRARAGGGVLMDLGSHMLDLAWSLMGQPAPASVYAVTHRHFADLVGQDVRFDVEDGAFALIRFQSGATLELACTWAINQPPQQNGTVCRMYGGQGAVEVYTPRGPLLYRAFTPKGEAKEISLKLPRTIGHPALMRHVRDCIHNKVSPLCGPAQGVVLMQMIDALYRSAATGKSVTISPAELPVAPESAAT